MPSHFSHVFCEGQERGVRLLAAAVLALFLLLSLFCSGCLDEESGAKAAPAPSPKRGAPLPPGGGWNPVGTWVDEDGRALCTFWADGSYSEVWTYNVTVLAYQGTWRVEWERLGEGGKRCVVVADAVRADDHRNPGKYALRFLQREDGGGGVTMSGYCYRMVRRK